MQLILASAALIVAVAADTTQQLAAACNPSNPHGIATIVNSCSVSAWVDSTGHPGDGGMMEIKPGKSYCENLAGNPSLKLANNSAADMQHQILQFEYSYDTGNNKIWFDGSNVNCAVQTGSTWDMRNCPFSSFTISGGSDPDAGNCKMVDCHAANQEPCQDSYQASNDDQKGMRDCPLNNSIKMTLCGGSGGSPSPAASSQSTASASTQAPAATKSTSAAKSSSGATNAVSAAAANGANASGATTVTHTATAMATTVVPRPIKRHEHRHPHWRH